MKREYGWIYGTTDKVAATEIAVLVGSDGNRLSQDRLVDLIASLPSPCSSSHSTIPIRLRLIIMRGAT